MRSYLLNITARRDDKVPLDATDAYPGCIIVNCPACGVTGALPPRVGGKVPLEIAINDVAYLDDIEQAFTTLVVSKRFRESVSLGTLAGIEFHDPIGYQIRTRKKGAESMVLRCRDEFQFQAVYVTGRGGSIAGTSRVKLLKSCLKCGWEEWSLPEQGIHVDESQWDGSDFFYVDEFGGMLMSQRAVDVLGGANLSNFNAQPAEEYRLHSGAL